MNLVRPEVPAELGAIVAKMMAKDPVKRYQKPIEVAQALAPFFVKSGLKGSPAAPAVSADVVVPKRSETMAPMPVATPVRLPTMVANPFSLAPEAAVKTPSPTKPRAIAPRWIKPLLFVAAGLVFLGLLLWVGGIILRVPTKDGTLVVEVHVNEPTPDVFVDGEKVVTVKWTKAGKKAEIRVKPGTQKVEVKKDGFTVEGGELTLQEGGSRILSARFEPRPMPALIPVPPPVVKDTPPPIVKDTPPPVVKDTPPPKKEIAKIPIVPAPGIDPNVRKAFIKGGDWKIDGDELIQEKSGDGEIVFGDITWTDYTFSCESQWIDGNPEHGMAFRYNPAGREVFFMGGWGNKECCATMIRGAKFTKQRRRGNGAVTRNAWNRLSVLVRGRHCECYRDGNLILQFDDINPNDLQGQVSLYSHGNTRFRNIRVIDPKGKVLFDGMPEAPGIKKIALEKVAAPVAPFQWPADKLAAGQIAAPDLSGYKPFRDSDFAATNPDTKALVLPIPGGYWFRNAGGFTDMNLRDFACEVIARKTGQDQAAWGVELNLPDKEPDRRGVSVKIMPFKGLDVMRSGDPPNRPYLNLKAHSAIREVSEWNRLLCVYRGRRLEVYVNDKAVTNPIEIDDIPTPSYIRHQRWSIGKAGGAQLEIQRFRIWDVTSLPSLEERAGQAKIEIKGVP